ncbi:hypothetical protein [Streptomyces toxytricini]|uniref:Uncharacterized protein n=1 Tax=Streptomyces toxytricini TaxID=67369 RepID=A0ABW8EEP6_STRT5
MLDEVTLRFIGTAAEQAPGVLAAVFDDMVRLRRRGGREASRAVGLSAAHESRLQAVVRAALLPRAGELDSYRSGLLSDAKSAYVIAARAVHRRAGIAEEHYELLLRPFAAAGIDVPPRAGGPPPRSA